MASTTSLVAWTSASLTDEEMGISVNLQEKKKDGRGEQRKGKTSVLFHNGTHVSRKSKEAMESPDGPKVTRMVTVDFGADLLHPQTHSQAIQRSNTTYTTADRGNDHMQIDVPASMMPASTIQEQLCALMTVSFWRGGTWNSIPQKTRQNGRRMTSFRGATAKLAAWVGSELGGSAPHQCR